MTIGEIQFANRAIGCMERIADALEGRQEDRWKPTALALAALYEARGKEWTLNEEEVALLVAVAKLSKVG